MNEKYGSGDPDNPAVSVVGLSRYIQERILQPLQAGFTNIFRVVKFGEQYEHLPALSAFILKENLAPAIAQWGLVVENFQIAQLETDEASRAAFNQWLSRLNGAEAAKFEEQRAAEARRYGIEQEGYGMAASRRAQGYTYQEERQFDVLQQAAGNAGVGGSFMSAGVGLAMGGAVGGVMGGMMANAAADAQASRQQPAPDIPPPATSSTQGASGVSVGLPAEPPTPAAVSQTASAPETKFCINCGAKIPRAAKFCAECGGAQ